VTTETIAVGLDSCALSFHWWTLLSDKWCVCSCGVQKKRSCTIVDWRISSSITTDACSLTPSHHCTAAAAALTDQLFLANDFCVAAHFPAYL